MPPSVDTQRHRRLRSRGLAAGVAAALALAVAGCSDPAAGGGNNSGPPLVTGEQVVTSCFHNYFYNGILPKAAAQTNCTSCVVGRLRRLGIQPSSGETVVDMLTGVRLSSADIRTLQTSCNVTDANSQ